MTEEPRETHNLEVSEESTQRKLDRMFWTKDQAKVIGDFLQGKEANINTTSQTWDLIKEETDFERAELPRLLNKALKFKEQRIKRLRTSESKDPHDTASEEYKYSSQKRALVIQQIIEPALRKAGLWSSEDSTRLVATTRLRPKKRQTFSQNLSYEESISNRGFIPQEEGGPQVETNIKTPQAETMKNLSDNRTRRALAHEIAHVIRALTNKKLWKGFEAQAEKEGVKQSKYEGRRKYLGGYLVGSNMQGSESLGELFSIVVDIKTKKSTNPAINDIIPEIENRFIKKLRKFKKAVTEYEKNVDEAKQAGEAIPEAPQSRYLAARLAFLHHAKQLQELGYGNIPAIDLVALGSLGHTSFEKAPYLIEAGLLTHDKYQKMRKVVRNVEAWLTSPGEKGFILKDFQNI